MTDKLLHRLERTHLKPEKSKMKEYRKKIDGRRCASIENLGVKKKTNLLNLFPSGEGINGGKKEGKQIEKKENRRLNGGGEREKLAKEGNSKNDVKRKHERGRKLMKKG